MSLSADKLGTTHESMAMVETVRSILKTKGNHVWSVDPDATVFEAIALMADRRIGALIVLSAGKLAGVISERDYARKVILKGHSSKETLVREIMTSSVVTVNPENTVAECMRIMTDHRVRHLPVLEGDAIVGVVSIGDLVNWIISAKTTTIHQLQTYIAGCPA